MCRDFHVEFMLVMLRSHPVHSAIYDQCINFMSRHEFMCMLLNSITFTVKITLLELC